MSNQTLCIAAFYRDWAINDPTSFIDQCAKYPVIETDGVRGLVQMTGDYEMTIELENDNVWVQWDLTFSMIYVAVKRGANGRLNPWQSHAFPITAEQHAAIREAVEKIESM
jgi:hypothetical protein